VYAALTIDRGWIPHDEGTLGQSALRALTGELPHRDFHDMYTGALSYWHALSFVLFGIQLTSPRIFLLLSFGAFLAVAYAVARRFAAPRTSAATVLLAAVWSLPNYPAAMPTWYNLFLAVTALWCLVRFLEAPRLAWLFAAGLCCGLSIVVKVVGLYTLAAMLIGLALVEADAGQDHQPDEAARPTLYSGAVAVGLGAYVMLVFWLVRSRLDPATVVHFVVPSAAVAAVASWRVTRSSGLGTAAERIARLGRLLVPLLAGATVPVALLLIPFVMTDSVPELVAGTLTLPSRLQFAAASPLPLAFFAPAIAPLVLGIVAATGPPRIRGIATGVLMGILLAVLGASHLDDVYIPIWGGLILAPVVATVATLAAAVRARSQPEQRRRALLAMLVATVLGTFVLVQYPFSGPVYFFYVAPLVALTALAGSALVPASWRGPMTALYAFALLFGALRIGPGDLLSAARGQYVRRPSHERLALDRGGIRVSIREKSEYEALVMLLRERAEGSGVTFVTPDAPEVYFLSGLRNPTPVLFDFLDPLEGRTGRTLALLDREGVRVVVLNREPQVSGSPPRELVAALESRYPRAASVGRFIVRWR
jgi:hypothetical protein